MTNLKTDSPLSRRIVRAFLDFLDSVEPASGVDLEGLEVARECLTEVFKLDSLPGDDHRNSDSLIDIFSSLEASEHSKDKSNLSHVATSVDAPSSSSTQNAADQHLTETSKYLNQGEDWTRESNGFGMSKDELFGQFVAALEKIHFFETTPDGNDDALQLDKATRLFHDTLRDMEKSGCQIYSTTSLAESLKSLGNRALQSSQFTDAIELYSCAISLYGNNAVFYCNRAAAYTQIGKYAEAVRDCLKSIELDPNYSKAYSRLGLAYYAQGKFSDAIEKGFKKVLQLDPNNESVKQNIQAAEKKLNEHQQRTERNQDSSSSSHSNLESDNQTGGSRGQGMPPPFASVSFNGTPIPIDIASMFMNMAGNANQGQQTQNRAGDENVNSGEPGIRLGENISLNFGEQMPAELTGALRSMMQMFSGAAPQGNSHDTMNGRPEGN
ncbi:Tetratricopeptide repeat-like superfamily protein putative isoform 2 [Tripterygium wilfordii]|uniref:Tetratricopeptide repeat-like superfamily protein putative isoform 2 n=1 Tax=Tripterygium wilfordii TaxID=458696 RepID=A0A7J7D221_TRIWF|nr:small glutamine-rich tetratricopeptide repeat-containing protein [Tripterygium wilfordii]KAF5740318.1 Tetratricopeptide repeat-like superfamily protein putative isoform 2 [Tripterygium wilfordii]